ncbi:MAG: ROK family protein [Bacteroidota bacterium]
MEVLGIDVGGSGVKGAPVNIKTGEMLTERHRIPTPQPADPNAIAKVVRQLAKHFKWKGPIGVGFPAAIQQGVARTAANIDKSWIGTDVAATFSHATGCPVKVVNDADAAGLAEIHFGAGKGQKGAVMLVTVGTGLGTALFYNGNLFPNSELGHIILKGGDAELIASDAARKRLDLDWEAWGKNFNAYLKRLEALLFPELFIIGGGTSKRLDKFEHVLTVKAKVKAAQERNNAGIIGAAVCGSLELVKQK